VIQGASQQSTGGESGFVLTAAAIAEVVGGRVIGDGSTVVSGVAPLDRASAQDLSFLGAAKYATMFTASLAGVVLVTPELAETPGLVTVRIVVDKPQESLLSLLPRFHRVAAAARGVHATAVIGMGATFGRDVSVGPYAVIGDGARLGDSVVIGAHAVVGAGVHVGDASHLYPSVTVYSGSVIGNRVTIHAGARIGSDGFGYVQRDGQHLKIPHVGRCIIEDDVEIGANTTIDRGTLGETRIGRGTKIDNLVMVAHGVAIGPHGLLAAQTGVSGSTRIGSHVTMAGQSGAAGHLKIGDRVIVAAKTAVFSDVSDR
jgi:UDP-3-O-[3-hydroxymyristoyl] glucosamine N-acyltransferase